MILTAQQLEAIAKIQAGMVRIEQIRKGINETLAANALHDQGVKGLNLYELGALVHGLNGLLFAHDLAQARQEEMYRQKYLVKAAA